MKREEGNGRRGRGQAGADNCQITGGFCGREDEKKERVKMRN